MEAFSPFCKQVAAENMARRPYINWAVKRVTRFLQVLWPRSRTNIFGSNATGMSLPTSDVDLVVCLPPVRNLEPIKEAGILEGRNGIKETCLQHAARYLANQDWVKNDSLKTVKNTAVKGLTEQFPAATPLALVLKQFLADRSLDQSDSGGLSSYCLVLLIIRFLQHEHHLGWPINQVNLDLSSYSYSSLYLLMAIED
ncbi:hypothetical protein JHK85_001715 [Glycine max]|uniref:DNA polymerase sigma n=1 Tax=Glycine soja TaxID=3848 RepID=A0A0B2SB69_GLYSO|nr:hypothetical protein JHK85_001715 [Glycine max]KAG5089063.1 hypothetical protein JHK86_001675 [Glycine max]KHN44001.1 DNA polymerase sigma [Glycine soja]